MNMATDALRAALAQATRVAEATDATLVALEATGAPLAGWYQAWRIAAEANKARYEVQIALELATKWRYDAA